jgi:hypothetical protein
MRDEFDQDGSPATLDNAVSGLDAAEPFCETKPPLMAPS